MDLRESAAEDKSQIWNFLSVLRTVQDTGKAEQQ